MRFSFTGNARWNDETTKNPSIRNGKTAKGAEYRSGGFGVNTDSSSAWVEGFGMVGTIKTFDTDNTSIEVDWSDRFDSDVIDSVASYRKSTVNIDGERKSFLSFYDMIDYLNDKNINGKKVTVTGQTQANVYNGKVSQRFQIQNVYSVDEDVKSKLQVSDVFYFTKDSFDTEDWSSEHKLNINGYINTYIDKNALGTSKGANKYVPFTIVFDCSKVNWDNEKHVKMVKFKLKQIGCDLVDGKIKVGLKKNVYKMAVVLSYVNGAEKEEITYDMLSDNQKEAIDLGIKTLEDFSGSVYGQRVTMYKLSDFDLRGDYEDGYVDTEISASELEEEIFVPAKEETLDEVMSKSEKVDNDDDDDVEEDLFD